MSEPRTGDALASSIEGLVLCHSPSGAEGEIDALLRARFAELGCTPTIDDAGNLIVKIGGRGGGSLAITAHKDEIGAVVTGIDAQGRVKVRRLGGAYPWIYGEGVVDLLGAHSTVSGILSFGSRHVSHASPQFAHKESAPVKWEDVWVETKQTPEELQAAGVRIGTRMVVGKHRKASFRLRNHIGSYALDNRASLAILLELAARVRSPVPDVYLVATAKEEIGAVGALHFTHRCRLDALVALEICPIAPEYHVEDGPNPVLLEEDSFGSYDAGLNSLIVKAAAERGIVLQHSVVNGFGSDGSISMKQGHVARAACLGFPTLNTHGFEITNLEALTHCLGVLEALCHMEVRAPQGGR